MEPDEVDKHNNLLNFVPMTLLPRLPVLQRGPKSGTSVKVKGAVGMNFDWNIQKNLMWKHQHRSGPRVPSSDRQLHSELALQSNSSYSYWQLAAVIWCSSFAFK